MNSNPSKGLKYEHHALHGQRVAEVRLIETDLNPSKGLKRFYCYNNRSADDKGSNVVESL